MPSPFLQKLRLTIINSTLTLGRGGRETENTGRGGGCREMTRERQRKGTKMWKETVKQRENKKDGERREAEREREIEKERNNGERETHLEAINLTAVSPRGRGVGVGGRW